MSKKNTKSDAVKFQRDCDAQNIIFVYGDSLRYAMSNGAKANYNRHVPTDKICRLMEDLFDSLLETCPVKVQKNIMHSTEGSWTKAKFPVQLLMYHKHRMGQPCETHVRFHFPVDKFMFSPIDIPIEDWEGMCGESKQHLAA